MNPAVVVIAYNRPAALSRLLASLRHAEYPAGAAVPLTISIDRAVDGSSRETVATARAFDWPHGPKTVLEQESHLGLVAHFRACGRLSRGNGGVVLLEDDLTVAPPFYAFASAALGRYREEMDLGGVCLYGLSFNGYSHDPFLPLDDGTDAFLLQVPYTQGLAFTSAQWQRFESWWDAVPLRPHQGLHPSFLSFGREEWFPRLSHYLAANQRFMCFPRVSLTTGWGDAGTHFKERSDWFQAPMQLRPRPYRLPDVEGPIAYDGFFELLPDRLGALAPHLPHVEFDLDLNATKQPVNLRQPYVLTSRPARSALAGFGLQMYPPERNIIENVGGEALSLARVGDVDWGTWAGAATRRRLHAYFWLRNPPSRRRAMRFTAAGLLQTARTMWHERAVRRKP